MAKRYTREEKEALDFWDLYYSNLNTEDSESDSIDPFEDPDTKAKRIKRLEADDEAWFKYYFKKYCTAEPEAFHKESTKRVMNNPEFYEARPWSRELSKSGRTMMEACKLALTGKKRFIIYGSATNEAAVRLLKPIKMAFEKNRRIINDYGEQENHGHWREDQFTAQCGALFIGVGSGNAPRGARNEEVRPDMIVMDDFDTDEDCRNPDTVDKKWEWFEQALYGTRSISNPLLVIFNGNIIADYCCMKKAIEMADYHQIVNIRDENGKSSWPAKNTEEMIDRVLKKISMASAQKEYFNNPIVLGKVFAKLNYGKMQPLHKYKFLIAYTDPSYKSGKKNDYKATVLIGKWKDEYHVIWVACDQTSTAKMLDWQFEILEYVDDRCAVYFWIEWPWIDDMLKQEIKAANKRHKRTLSLKPDDRTKPEKFYRIEANLEPLNRSGKLVFNIELKGKPFMKNMEFQFLALSPKSRAHDDGPDAVEGGVWRVNHKSKESTGPIRVYAIKPNQKRY
ncbi:hypothetical protein CMU81_00910 [Elizabethkingia anophelis]|nr:hypothetical protein [Elizabethkingia anophelis]MDV4025724.1 hypothetical protein [Elizabethkingia anophelis]